MLGIYTKKKKEREKEKGVKTYNLKKKKIYVRNSGKKEAKGAAV